MGNVPGLLTVKKGLQIVEKEIKYVDSPWYLRERKESDEKVDEIIIRNQIIESAKTDPIPSLCKFGSLAIWLWNEAGLYCHLTEADLLLFRDKVQIYNNTYFQYLPTRDAQIAEYKKTIEECRAHYHENRIKYDELEAKLNNIKKRQHTKKGRRDLRLFRLNEQWKLDGYLHGMWNGGAGREVYECRLEEFQEYIKHADEILAKPNPDPYT